MSDDLDCNPFYNALQDCFPDVFDRAQAMCWNICVPQSVSLEGIAIDRPFIDLHILKPSPFFKGQYLTTGTAAEKHVLLEGNTLTTTEGFQETALVKIIGEETSYNKEYKPFKILILERPLVGSAGTALRDGIKVPAFDAYLSRYSFQELHQYLQELPECDGAITMLQQKLEKFMQSYMMLQGYLSEAAQKLQKLHTECTKMVLAPLARPLQGNPRVVENVERAVESELIGGCHSTLFPLVCAECQARDRHLTYKLQQLQHMTPQQLGLQPEYNCSLATPVGELKQLTKCRTPLEKLHCLKNTLDTTVQSVNTDVSAEGKDAPCITTDELIPLLTLVLVECGGLITLCSDLYYAEHFHWASSKADDLSFSLVTFSAAVEYTLSLKTPPSSHDATAGLKTEEVKVNSTVRPNKHPTSKDPQFVDELNCITKMLQNSTPEFIQAASRRTASPLGSSITGLQERFPDVLPAAKAKAPLGDFLSSLQDDGQYSSYGRLT